MRNSLVPRRVPIDDVRLPARPLLHHPPKQVAKARKFVDALDFAPIITAAADGEILHGEEYWLALKARGDAFVDVVFVNDKSQAELTAIRIALYRIPQDSKLDQNNLRLALEDLDCAGIEISITGLETYETDPLLDLDIPSKNVEESGANIPPLQSTPVSTPGVRWRLNKHCIGCGDAADHAFLARILNGRLGDLSLSDPPYNVPIDGFVGGKGQHHHRSFIDWSGNRTDAEFFQFLCDYFQTVKAHCRPNALAIAFIDWRHICEMTAAGRVLGLPLYQVITWVKSNGGMGGIWRNQSEFACVFRLGDEPPTNNRELGKHGYNRSNVWNYPGYNAFGRDRDDLLRLHPTVKPVAMLADAIKDITHRGDIVIDSFLGSGSTLIAAEQTGRICCGVELDPLYVDVTVRRWQDLTGRSAACADTGETFDERAQRLLRQQIDQAGHDR